MTSPMWEDNIEPTVMTSAIELWGGLECTINRVHEQYFDQHVWSGHRNHMNEDLALVAQLGVKTLRCALHWEYFEATQNWAFYDKTLEAMTGLGIDAIAGLLHHGSGPRGTDLLDLQFPEKLAAYALQVARRYPFITRYTPVNEPNTTSRFSCLYGHWYPHHRSMESYLRALLNEVKGTVLSMQAIRSVQPLAELVYTEDGGGIFGTAATSSFQQERDDRRWLGMDLLAGRVTRKHPLYAVLRKHHISEDEIAWFARNVCLPSVLGLNYYLTSDRFLDDRVDLYPSGFRGGDSGSEPLVDIEAVRVRPEGIQGVAHVLEEAWDRYGVPVAITEVHLGGESDDQLRWLSEVWTGAQRAASSGVDVRAITIWALFGSWNWCNLCTRDDGVYEPGPFDLSSGSAQATPLTSFMENLTHGRNLLHPALAVEGWWNRDDRILYAKR